MMKQNESGRTMLEMLGVLGIMGIIMYGAVSGINYGMSTYKINQIYNDVQEQIQAITDLYSWSRSYTGTAANPLTQVACENDVFSRGCKDDNSAGLHPYGEGITITPEPESGAHIGDSFKLEYSNIPDDVCNRLLEMEWGVIKATADPSDCDGDDQNQMIFEPDPGDD